LFITYGICPFLLYRKEFIMNLELWKRLIVATTKCITEHKETYVSVGKEYSSQDVIDAFAYIEKCHVQFGYSVSKEERVIILYPALVKEVA
jgi:hypothetical protein